MELTWALVIVGILFFCLAVVFVKRFDREISAPLPTDVQNWPLSIKADYIDSQGCVPGCLCAICIIGFIICLGWVAIRVL